MPSQVNNNTCKWSRSPFAAQPLHSCNASACLQTILGRMSWESFRLRLIEHPHGTFFLGELSLLKTSHLSLVPGKHYKEVQIHHHSWDQLQAFEDAFWILTLRCKYLYLHYKCNVYNMSVLSLDVLLMRSEFCHFDAQVTLPLYTFEQLRLHISMQIQTLIVLEHTLLRLRHTHKTTTIGDRC